MRFMAIKEKDYWYFKRICYKGKLSKTINNNPTSPIKRPKPKNPERRSNRDRPTKRFDSENKSSDSDGIGDRYGKPNTRRKGRNRGRGPRNRGRDTSNKKSKKNQIQNQQNLPRAQEDLRPDYLIILTEIDNVTKELKTYIVKYVINKKKEESIQYIADITKVNDKDNPTTEPDNIKYLVDEYTPQLWKKVYPFEKQKQLGENDWKIYNNYITLKRYDVFQFKDTRKDKNEYIITEESNENNYTFTFELNNGSSSGNIPYTLDLRKRFVKKIKQGNPTYAEEGDGDDDEDNYNPDDENSGEEEEEVSEDDNELINDPVDSIVATYPYLSLE